MSVVVELYEVLIELKADPNSARRAAEAVDHAIQESRVAGSRDVYVDRIVPLEKEQTGIRAEIAILAERMAQGFAAADKRFDSQDKRFDSQDKRFDSLDKRLDLMQKFLWLNVAIVTAILASIVPILLKLYA